LDVGIEPTPAQGHTNPKPARELFVKAFLLKK